jgi:hypothetical protein
MFRNLLLPLALLSASGPALAASHFQAQAATQPTQTRFVARENLWTCSGALCGSNRTSTRPAIVCSTLARQVGPLASFSVAGRPFSAEELENCNGRAR